MRILAPMFMLISSSAYGAWPEDVSISSMTDYDGVRVLDSEVLSADYAQLIRELGTTVSAYSLMSAESLGATGFEVVAETAFSFNDSQGTSSDPAPWARAHINEDPGSFTYLPGFTIRKGLPFSIDLGMGVRWMGNSRQAVVNGFVRAALVEGFKPWPDLNLHLGYAGYIGNDELRLGVFEAGLTLGTQAVVGTGSGPRTTRLSPFVDVSLLTVTATPVVDDDVVTSVGAVTYGRRGGNPELAVNQRAITIPRFSGGFQILMGQLSLRMSGGYSLNATPFAAASIGFIY